MKEKSVTRILMDLRAKKDPRMKRDEFFRMVGMDSVKEALLEAVASPMDDPDDFTEKTFRSCVDWFFNTDDPARLARKILMDDMGFCDDLAFSFGMDLGDMIGEAVEAAYAAFVLNYVPCTNEKITAYHGEVMQRKFFEIIRRYEGTQKRGCGNFVHLSIVREGEKPAKFTISEGALDKYDYMRMSPDGDFTSRLAEMDLLKKAVDLLSERECAVVMGIADGKSQMTLAEELGTSQSWVSAAWRRGIDKMRKFMLSAVTC